MPPAGEQRRPPITPQLAVRVAVLAGLAFVVFGVVFFRLWFLQVLTGDDFVSQARDNRERRVRIEAPRGDVVDRHGQTLVKTRVAPVVQIVPSALPAAVLAQADAFRAERSEAENERLAAADRLRELERVIRRRGRRGATPPQRRERRRLSGAAGQARRVDVPPLAASDTETARLYRRLGRVIDVPPATIHERVIEGVAETPYANVTIKTAVSRTAFNYLRERREDFPGVAVEKQYLRYYPFKELGAQLFGTLREISPEELEERRYRGVEAGTRIGADGIEEAYDSYLRGRDGFSRVVINSLGNRDDQREVTRREPEQGNRLKLTLDLDLQRVANDALRQGVEAAAANGAKAGAYVAMDPRNGEILALGSYPSFDANLFAKPISQDTFDKLRSEENGAPLFNRAISATYPTGSTFKPVTAMAALESGALSLGETITDDGTFTLGGRDFKNAQDAAYGTIELVQALTVSSDVFFYELGFRMDELGGPLQEWARRLGYGRPTGIEIPGEFPGLVPSEKWRNEGYDEYAKCTKDAGVTPGTPEAWPQCGGIERPWSAGDNVNLSVGQGDIQATPLQLATSYATLANHGKVVRPHLGMEIQDGGGRVVEELRTPIRRRLDLRDDYVDAILSGLKGAATAGGGTSTDVFAGLPYAQYLHGKTGTAERQPNPDQSWYAAYVAHPSKPIVVVTTIERGGFGAETAAPAARLILNEWFDVGNREFRAGTSTSY